MAYKTYVHKFMHVITQ